MLWECFLEEHYQAKVVPVWADPLLASLWQAFEQLLTSRCPEALIIYTTEHEPLYESKQEWQHFLSSQGYTPSVHRGVVGKLTQ